MSSDLLQLRNLALISCICLGLVLISSSFRFAAYSSVGNWQYFFFFFTERLIIIRFLSVAGKKHIRDVIRRSCGKCRLGLSRAVDC